MKPVWFTEFGFPAVDGCANQPNVFYDPSSSESFFPRDSKGRVDLKAQREALTATIIVFEKLELEGDTLKFKFNDHLRGVGRRLRNQIPKIRK